MANREELAIIRGARSGEAAAQLALGKLYLFGGTGLPRNGATALHWLCRAAQQGHDEAWRLIGAHIPYEVAHPVRGYALPWFARAAQAGVSGAAATLALLQDDSAGSAAVAAPASVSAGQSGSAPACVSGPGGTAGALRCGAGAARPVRAGAPAAAAPAALPDGLASAPADPADPADQLRRLTQAAQQGERDAQLALGLHLARMNPDGERLEPRSGTVNFKRALRWLAQAGEQGVADAWYAMSRIYIRPEFSQRSASEAHACLQRAADMGHSGAQLECGMHAWRARRGGAQNDVRALYWLQKAAAQGSTEAHAALDRIAPPPAPASWADSLLPLLTRELLRHQPLLAARIELAALFRLSRAEALLLDVKLADQGHCLVVDIRASYGRSKRRLLPLRTAAERQALDRIVRLFEQVDANVEGNYRQRLYRLKSWFGAEGGQAFRPGPGVPV